ncbi:PTS sugar transporter subunit IIA [Alcaligenes sp. SDU_A2]|uniref:PTS sugar transporter subunit IIA n=1 Tax=Alcaligenes sp. SDU_A2 TaxID=3136634 RepID=UPI002C8D0317|nr:PTS sugar transporter subunit IIA [Alcaligenes sp.]HRL28236.1 PTS sugar transporter subunit IIA [Alcaligenes sp.]
MIRLALIMHEPLASAFASCAEHVLGERPDLFVFDIQADECTDTAVERLLAQLQTRVEPATLILCDLYGATPFNVARRVQQHLQEQGQAVHLLTGTNMCMVLKALTERRDNPERLAQDVMEGAMRGIVDADCHC